MSYKTVEVDLDNGHVRPFGSESLPAKARALLTVLEHADIPRTGKELAERWAAIEKMPAREANAFADDLEKARESLPGIKSAWD